MNRFTLLNSKSMSMKVFKDRADWRGDIKSKDWASEFKACKFREDNYLDLRKKINSGLKLK